MRSSLRERLAAVSIEAILFDADGVIQRPAPARRQMLRELLGPKGNQLDEFIRDLWAAEDPTLTGQAGFAEALSAVLARWKCRASLDEALHVWTMIEVDAEILGTVQALRRSGVCCHLATNQELHRARHMSETLGYAGLFDREFYSCRVGLMKPDPEYFRAVLREIDLPAGRVLFLDDREVNVQAAHQVGLRAAVFVVESGLEALHRTLREFGLSPLEDA